DVLSKGKWLKRENASTEPFKQVDWSLVPEYVPDFDLDEKDFDFNDAVGIEMVNDVITKPYEVSLDLSVDELSSEHDESFLMLIDRHGKWRVNAVIKGFANQVQGLASSYSNTGDIILIGKDKNEMLLAFREMKRMKGGMMLVEDGEIAASIPLPIGGGLSAERMEVLIDQEVALKQALAERGYKH